MVATPDGDEMFGDELSKHRSTQMNKAFEVAKETEAGFDPDWVDVESTQHHYDYIVERGEVDVVLSKELGHDIDGDVYDDVSTFELHEFVRETVAFGVWVRNVNIDIDGTDLLVKVTYRVGN